MLSAGEERIAAALRERGVHHALVRHRSEQSAHERLHLVAVERLELDHGAAAVLRHPLDQPFELAGGTGAGGPQRGDREQLQLAEPGEQGHQRERVGVGEMRVLDQEDGWRAGRERAEGLDGACEHELQVSVRGGAAGAGAGVQALAQAVEELGGVGAGAALRRDPREHVAEHRVRDAAVELVRPADQRPVSHLLRTREHLARQPRFPDARLAPDEEAGRPAVVDALQLPERNGEVASPDR